MWVDRGDGGARLRAWCNTSSSIHVLAIVAVSVLLSEKQTVDQDLVVERPTRRDLS